MSRNNRKLATKAKALAIYSDLTRGFQPSEIALGREIPERTVQYYLHEAGRILDGQFKSLTAAAILRQLWVNHQERRRALWQQYAKTPEGYTLGRASLINLLQKEDAILEHIAERLNILEPIPTKLELEGRVTERKELAVTFDVRYSDDKLTRRVSDFLSRLR